MGTNGMWNGKERQNKESLWTRALNTWINTEIIRLGFPILTKAGTFIHFIQWQAARRTGKLLNTRLLCAEVEAKLKRKSGANEHVLNMRERMWVRGQGQRSRRHRPLQSNRSCVLINELINSRGRFEMFWTLFRVLTGNVNWTAEKSQFWTRLHEMSFIFDYI